jgi:hypothetical protein
MIDVTQAGWWPEYDEPQQQSCEVFDAPRARVSELLGPDGEPLMVGYERPKLGFDLTPRRT